MKTVIKKLHCLSFGKFVSLLFADEKLNLLGEKTTDRGIPPHGEEFGLAKSRFA
jgi:hypothetical protein